MVWDLFLDAFSSTAAADMMMMIVELTLIIRQHNNHFGYSPKEWEGVINNNKTNNLCCEVSVL